MHHVYFLMICLVWGSNFILMHRAGQAFGALEIGFLRLLGSGITLALLWRLTDRQTAAWRHAPHIALIGIFGLAYPFALQPMLISQGFGHSYFGITVSFVPLMTIVFSVLMLRIWPTWRELVGVIGGLVALVFLLWEGQIRGMSPTVLALAFSVPVAYAASNTYIRWKLRDVPAIPLTMSLHLTGAAVLLPLFVFPGIQHDLSLARPAEPTHWAAATLCVAWLATMGTGITGFLFVRLVHSKGPLFAGMVSYLLPIIALGWGAYDREPITLRQVAAVLIVLVMVALVQIEPRRQRATVGGQTAAVTDP